MKHTHARSNSVTDVETIAVGTELVLGGRADTNSVFLAEALASMGIAVRWKTVVGDDKKDIREAISQAVLRTKVVMMTGGLGPTFDDLTRESVASATRRPLRCQPSALKTIKKKLASRGRTFTRIQHRQAMIPAGAVILPNPVGTAPGFFLQYKRCLLFVLPGVPHEAKAMFAAEVVPILREELDLRQLLSRRVLHTCGLPESEVEMLVRPLLRDHRDIQMGLTVSPLGVSLFFLRWQNRGQTHSPVFGRYRTSGFDALIGEIRQALGRHVYGEGSESMEEIVGRQLTGQGVQLALAESCTGGLIGHRLTQVPGSSRYVERGVICYSNQAKTDLVDVSSGLLKKHGAVSAQVAAAMAKGIHKRSGADIGLSVTGIAGPDGGTKEKPVGLVYIGLSREKDCITQEYRFYGDRDGIKLRASQAALNMVRLCLEKTAGVNS